MVKNAFKRRHEFALRDPEKYRIFLKKHFTSTRPKFWSIIEKCRVRTRDGIMYALTLSEDIENPNHDTIAECVVNGEMVYLWNDQCWGMAVDHKDKPVSRTIMPLPFNPHQTSCKRKSVLLYRIGTEPVE